MFSGMFGSDSPVDHLEKIQRISAENSLNSEIAKLREELACRESDFDQFKSITFRIIGLTPTEQRVVGEEVKRLLTDPYYGNLRDSRDLINRLLGIKESRSEQGTEPE
jgi:hypothetical protein